mmetsp:Transcript_27007/g.58789  ORF Transcript_27007/g.58789 Transcript_27007/m.58789 type:complete len:156 (-) Transcript_27007:16-483(-)
MNVLREFLAIGILQAGNLYDCDGLLPLRVLSRCSLAAVPTASWAASATAARKAAEEPAQTGDDPLAGEVAQCERRGELDGILERPTKQLKVHGCFCRSYNRRGSTEPRLRLEQWLSLASWAAPWMEQICRRLVSRTQMCLRICGHVCVFALNNDV